jgi:hypothetical protein
MKLNSEYVSRAPEWRSDGEDTINLPASHVVDHHVLIVDYDWAVAGGTGAGAIHSDAYARILREFVLRGNNQDLQSLSGSALHLYNLLLQRESFTQTPPTSVAAGAAQAARQSVILLPTGHMGHAAFGGREFAFPPILSPKATFRWGTAQDLTTSAADGVASFANVRTKLLERFHQQPLPPRGGYAPVLIAQKTQQVAAAGSLTVELDFLFSASTGGPGMEVRAILVEGLTDGVGGRRYAPSNAVVTDLRVKISGETVRERVEFADMRQLNKVTYGLGTLVTGAVLLDAAEDETVVAGELWTVHGRGANEVILTVAPQGAGQNMVRVTTVYTAGRFDVAARRRAG